MSGGAFYRASVRRMLDLPPVWSARRPKNFHEIDQGGQAVLRPSGSGGAGGAEAHDPGIVIPSPTGYAAADNGSGCNGLAAKAGRQRRDGQRRPVGSMVNRADVSQCHTELQADPEGVGELRKAAPKVDWADVAKAYRNQSGARQGARKAIVFEAIEDVAEVPAQRSRPATARPVVAAHAPRVEFSGKMFCGQCDRAVTAGEAGRCVDAFCKIGVAK